MGPAFRPHPLLKHAHLMSIIPGLLPRHLKHFVSAGTRRLFKIDEHTSLLAYLHFHEGAARQAPTLVLLHGLEGSSESSHVVGIGYKAFMNGFNVIRLNMRNCGGSMQYARTLYNAGLYQDILKVMEIVSAENDDPRFVLSGYSLGGNLLLNAAAVASKNDNHNLIAVCAVSPSIDLSRSVEALESPENQVYAKWFLSGMKRKVLAKFKQHPDMFDVTGLHQINTIKDFDDRFTAPDGGYGSADRYYEEASSINKLKDISVPTLIIASEDDPLVPIGSFHEIADVTSNKMIELLITDQGGHCGFLQARQEDEKFCDHFWAENRVVAFMKEVSRK